MVGIPEDQLDIWAKQGSITQSKNTYATIDGVLNSGDAPYAKRGFTTFLQGSYGNDTNVYADSDVDIVLRLDAAFQYDLHRMDEPHQASWRAAHTTNAEYGLVDFRAEAVAWLTQNYRGQVDGAGKAIAIAGNGNRRDADVLACIKFRRYYKFNGMQDQSYAEGIAFRLKDGTSVENYPKQHAENCTSKHQATKSYFKPMVRIIKNMRNKMRDDGIIEPGLAPSYYLEGLLYNVPNELFGHSYQRSFLSAYSWIRGTDKTKLTTANNQFWLLRSNTHTSWDPAKFDKFFQRLGDFWDNW